MCGRYSLLCIDDLGNRFRVHNPMIGSRSHFNVSPASEMPVIVRKEKNEMVRMRWGLVPFSTKDLTAAPKPINARAESLLERPMFAPLLTGGRCLIPASGFFEWKTEGKQKVPFWFHLPESPLFAFAGLYDTWQGPDRHLLSTYTIITCRPNALLADVHERMPVILSCEGEQRWLSPALLSREDLGEILVPCPATLMEKVPVSSLVNNPSVDDERVIRPLASSAGKQTFLTG